MKRPEGIPEEFAVMSPKKKDDSYRDFVLDQLGPLEGVDCRPMFGGYGLYLGTEFFGILHEGRLYFKTGEESRAKYRDRGMGPFSPGGKQVLKTYYEVPGEVVEDHEELVSWAREAAAMRGKARAQAGKGK